MMDRPMQLPRRCAALLVRGYGAIVLPVLLLLLSAPAMAQGVGAPGAVVARPRPWEMWMQPGYSPVKKDMIWLNDDIVTPIIVFIVILVGALLLYVLWRFDHRRNPVPSRLTHNGPLEIAWTVIPALVLVGMAIPSFRLVFFETKTNDPYMTVKVTGHQWYWEYAYPNQGNIDFMSNMIPQNQLKPGQYRLLSVNHPLVVPVNENIRILTTSGDVIHSFFVPALGVQRYAIPGQTIETWMRADRVGTYYGECNQICGIGHHEMPIQVQAVPLPQFLAWAKTAKQELSRNGTVPPVAEFAAAAGGGGAPVTRVAEVTHNPAATAGRGD
jgi:cytochrome c oxidase subunit II